MSERYQISAICRPPIIAASSCLTSKMLLLKQNFRAVLENYGISCSLFSFANLYRVTSRNKNQQRGQTFCDSLAFKALYYIYNHLKYFKIKQDLITSRTDDQFMNELVEKKLFHTDVH